MGLCFPSTPKKLAMTIGLFASGAALFALGLHQCYVNNAPQRARVKARNDFVRERGYRLVMNPIRRKNSGPICLGYPICSMICFPTYSYNNTTMSFFFSCSHLGVENRSQG
ncbi:hypothetical protein NC653_021880 [Populus alba x Populus x berolinensis]|uniref:Uncharacterized protein n=1 Tax=Populus alba x Populus x berolinensis TaxID=444605 RepID=A0AAD6MQV6_9ROSI|nr:hypothetical protein NC653_021880 [Populus alba x Populus x berolinensis]